MESNVEDIIVVSDEEIVDAMHLIWERMKIVCVGGTPTNKEQIIEPSSAVVLAAVLSDKFKQLSDIKTIGLILSGGNVDLDTWDWQKAKHQYYHAK